MSEAPVIPESPPVPAGGEVLPPEIPPAGGEPWLGTAPDDWREQLAGEDTSKLNQLKRVSNPNQLIDNYFAAQEKIRTGSIAAAAAPDEHSTPEEWAEYRQQHGIPDAPENYELALSEGLVLGAEDKEIIDQVLPIAHELNIGTPVISKLADALLHAQQAQHDRAEVQQNEWQRDATQSLKAVWKGDFATNINMIQNTILGTMPESIREEFAHAAMPDGRKIMNSPEVMAWMADMARKIDPAGAVVPNSTNAVADLAAERKALETRMGEPGWHKDDAAQTRYQEILRTQERMG